MLTEPQERLFDMYFHFAQSGMQSQALDILGVIRCSLGKETEEAPVIKYLLKKPGACLDDIRKGTGKTAKDLSRILRGPQFALKYTPRGCVYGVNGSNPEYDNSSRGSVVAGRKVSPSII